MIGNTNIRTFSRKENYWHASVCRVKSRRIVTMDRSIDHEYNNYMPL